MNIDIRYSTTFAPAARAAETARPQPPTPRALTRELAGPPARTAVFPASVTGALSCFTPRQKRFVDHMPCPTCGHPSVGVEFHGVLMSGAKVHELAKHAPGRGNRRGNESVCLGSKVRVVFEHGDWRAE